MWASAHINLTGENMSSYSSDQTTLLLATIGADTLARAGRARITFI